MSTLHNPIKVTTANEGSGAMYMIQRTQHEFIDMYLPLLFLSLYQIILATRAEHCNITTYVTSKVHSRLWAMAHGGKSSSGGGCVCLLLDPAHLLSAPDLHPPLGAPARRAEDEHGAAVGRRHLPELRLELAVRVAELDGARPGGLQQ
uniref:Uncharacterized protein n=1 Tax=Oryza brachyantha TaxID=4533 RepID=J3M8A8_ORYBR